jgi:uncharacterized protein (TIGR03435 family)
MKRFCLTLICLVVLCRVPFAQETPRFEVASIRPSAEQTNQVTIGVSVNGSQVRISYWTLKDYLAMAYAVKPDQISGPDWLAQTRFDISAKLPEGASEAQVDAMLQALLIDRFQLKMHRDKREFSVYALAAARGGAKLTPVPPKAPDAGAPGGFAAVGSGNASGVGIDFGGGSSFNLANGRIDVTRMALADLAEMLARFLDRPVVDTTELKGQYDMTLELTPEDYAAMRVRSAVRAGVPLPPQALRALDYASADPLSAALQKYGLIFESRRMPLDVIVVDSMLRTPTEN